MDVITNNPQQPTYEELAAAYSRLLNDYQAIRSDKILERLKIMMDIVMNKTAFDSEIVELANWHMKQIMAKPKDE